jgi:hypothetical protein
MERASSAHGVLQVPCMQLLWWGILQESAHFENLVVGDRAVELESESEGIFRWSRSQEKSADSDSNLSLKS